jgi:electron transfer flavoprotein alpha subunit
MSNLLCIAHTEPDGGLSRQARETLSAALALAEKLGTGLEVGLIGKDVQAAADSLAGCGAAGFLAVSGPEYDESKYYSDAAAVQALVGQSGAEVVVAQGSYRLNKVLPGAAYRLGGRCDTGVTGLTAENGSPRITRWFYRQRMFADMSREQRPWIIAVAPCCFVPWEGEAGQADVTAVQAEPGDKGGAAKVTGREDLGESTDTIRPDAELLLVAGAGWTKKQSDGQTHVDRAEELILGFVDKARASLGSSKSMVDVSSEGGKVLPFITHLHQVGQTGSTPRHQKGLATCCHGEEPHVVGWRFIGERRAVNLDASCGWAQGKADVLYVADAFEVMQKVNELLGK